VYLANQPNNVEHIVDSLAQSRRYSVSQQWVALGGDPPTPAIAAVTARIIREKTPKYQILNEVTAGIDLTQYEYVISTDDDITLPHDFIDCFIPLQNDLEFRIAQPARTANSYIDLPIVEQQLGVVARQTRWVEIGPLVSFHRSIYDVVFPFDLTSGMGWGFENVWSYTLDQRGLKMGIIDILPVDHSMRKPVVHYSWDEADRGRTAFLAKHKHFTLDECFRIIDIVPFEEAEA
jgi:hypothetical protein